MVFKKGYIPWNKGMNGVVFGGRQFKKGHTINKGNKYNLGRLLTPNIKNKISKTLKEKYANGQKSRITSHTYKKGDLRISGENNPNWKGGITPINLKIRHLPEYYIWRFSIYTRDEFTCQKCGKVASGELEAHHIKPFSKIISENKIKSLEKARGCAELWDLNNGITLCEHCHNPTRGRHMSQ